MGNHLKAEQNLRTTLLKIIDRAGLLPWPRLFQNLRSSRETELANANVPLTTVTRWLGNTPAIAMKHYIQDRDEDYLEAAGIRLSSGAKTGALPVLNQLQTRTGAKCGRMTSGTQMPAKSDVRQFPTTEDNFSS